MTRTILCGASALVGLSMLFGQASAMAQNPGGQNQPQAPADANQPKSDASKQADQPKSDASKQADKPKSDASKQSDQPKSDASKQADKPKSDAAQKDQPSSQADKKSDRPVDPQTTDRNRSTDRATDRSTDRSRQSTDRTQDADRSRQQSTDRSQPTDRSRQQSTDRSQPTDRSRQQSTDRSQPTDRSRQQSTDRSQQTDHSRQQSTDRSQQQISAKDLGFAFSSESTDRGLVVDNISSRSIASRAEFQEGDIIVSVHDHRIRSQNDFIRYIDLDATDRIPVVVLRDDREVTVYLDPTVIREEVVVSGHGWLGVDLEDRERRAAVVHRVHPGSPAEKAGLRSGDMILTVEGTEIRSPEHLGEVIGGMRPGSQVEIEVDRNRRATLIDATLGEKKEVATRRTEIR